ncbi:MAG: FAD-dependent oxidoreductase [Candidatus Thorarchaeota archaeon]|jgi:heterodisulfide reductase subunit A
MTKTVVVIGAGVAGLQVTQQLADLGVRVHLIERDPFVGGLSAHLGKVFPTDDCALCLDACSELFDGKHRRCQYRALIGTQQRVTLHTQSELKSIKKEDGRYSISIRIHPRYVIPDRCVVCLECMKVCQSEARSELDLDKGIHKAIYRQFPQSIPLAPVIDKDSCDGCNKCVEVCHVGAIDLGQKAKSKTIKADAVVLATGVEEHTPSSLPGYSYSESDDILTQTDVSQQLKATL